jgi:hypothetical protein
MTDRAVGAHRIPQSVRTLSSLRHVDYADQFTVATDAQATPEHWARAMFGDVPSVGEQLIWRGFLGLRLSRGRSPDTVAGWRIADRGADWIRIEATSWFLSANMVVLSPPGRLALATFVRCDRPPARIVWRPLSAVHRALVPGVLRGAVAKVRAAERQAR